MNYYNEFNPEAAAMLRQMIADGVIAPGVVDDRSITEVSADELKGYNQCHFFAGIGGWSVALRLAGWPDDRPVWTGSAPCQPFAAPGKHAGKDDPRHLFPVWLDLITDCRPATIFGEQSKDAITKGWLDDVYQGLEAQGYAVGAAVLPACSIGAPHLRERLWFVAHAQVQGGRGVSNGSTAQGGGAGHDPQPHQRSTGGSLDNSNQPRLEGQHGDGRQENGWQEPNGSATETGFWDSAEAIPCYDGKYRFIEPSISLLANGVQHRRPLLHAIGNAIVPQVAAEFIKAAANDNRKEVAAA
jgi:DNA (cytosine-5)-methyltransferase 1